MSARLTKGKFISLEGGEGVGKSTQLRALSAALEARGIEVVTTREPGGSDGAEKIRQLLLADHDAHWSPRAEALLFAAARADHVEKTIRPALEEGKWVVSDRFLDSSVAYQGGAGHVGAESIRELHNFGSEGFLPDRTLVLLFGNKEAIERARIRDLFGSDRIGGRPLDFHYDVFLAFQLLAADEPDRVKLVDGSGEIEEVTQTLLKAIEDLLP